MSDHFDVEKQIRPRVNKVKTINKFNKRDSRQFRNRRNEIIDEDEEDFNKLRGLSAEDADEILTDIGEEEMEDFSEEDPSGCDSFSNDDTYEEES
jgi:hypothetical protein